MGSLLGETMAARRQVVFPASSNSTTVRRGGETTAVNSGVRSPYHVDGGTLRQRSSSGRALQSPSPSPAAVTAGSESSLKSHRAVNGWAHSDAFASDTEATSPTAGRHRRSQTSNGDGHWLPCMYMSANNLRHNSSGQRSSRSSTSGQESTSGSILKKRSDCNARLDANSSCSSSTIVGSVLDKYRPAGGKSTNGSGESHKSRSTSQRLYSDSSTASVSGSSQPSRRVGFKNNVAVYRFDSDGEDSAGYSSTVSETSEQLGGHPRTQSQGQRQRQRRPSHPQPHSSPTPRDRPLTPVLHDAAASWAAARGWSSAADRVGSPRYGADGSPDRRHPFAADSVPSPTRSRSNSVGSGQPQFITISKTMYVGDCDDDDYERRRTGSVGSRTLKRDQSSPVREHITQSQRKLPSADDGCVLSCGSIAIHNPLFIDRAHYEYIQAGKGAAKRLVLTCSLKHTKHFNPDCLVVKANRTGTRARVVFGVDRDAQQNDEPIDQLLLPYVVDPYRLTAQLQGDSSLVIEAPILLQSP